MIGAATAAVDLISATYAAISEAKKNNTISEEDAAKWEAFVKQRLAQPHWVKSTK